MTFSFASDHLRDETKAVNELLSTLSWDANRARRVETVAQLLIGKLRAHKTGTNEIEHFLMHFPLQSNEGLALMTLAEALLRIPDNDTKDALIEEKITNADWSSKDGGDMFLKAAGTGLSLARKTLGSFLGTIGKPVIRKSLEEAVKRIGQQFVVGETIQDAIKKGKDLEKQGYRLSYDMLGEGARTREDAERYYRVYETALNEIGKAGSGDVSKRSGMSVKLSALHPRYTWSQEAICVPEMTAKLIRLCEIAASYNMGLTVDAEEADRLELSLKIIEGAMASNALKNWNGFGLAIQAYDKRCFRLVDDLYALARKYDRKIQVRLVKGAYWDSEIKRSQIAGFSDYPLYTRKANTDLSYLACAEKMLKYRDRFYPMFATHNAQSVAAVLDLAGEDRTGFEFQRLYGMGETLGNIMIAENMAPVCIYAPTGSYEDLLPYLVRRMLENGANSSFVHQLRETSNDTHDLSNDAIAKLRIRDQHRHIQISLPRYLYPDRLNSEGIDLSANAVRSKLDRSVSKTAVSSLIGGEQPSRKQDSSVNPLPGSIAENAGEIWEASPDLVDQAFHVARKGNSEWSKVPVRERAQILKRVADILEKNRDRLIALLQSEAGRTINDAISEIREAADFCRYYAVHGEKIFAESGEVLKGPTGESNTLVLKPRGTFVCISPWNFPCAIFIGQIVAALVAGNAVIAKPAEQTPVIAFHIIKMMIEAGIPKNAISLILGDGKIGAMLVGHRDVAGVVFTGSTSVAQNINRALAAKDGPIVPLIAETGGQNAMMVESSALLEQVVDDVVLSAFGSAGQRCSALRVVYVQDEVADRFCELLKGAMREVKLGDPRELSTDIGPVIDREALKSLEDHQVKLKSFAKLVGEAPKPPGLSGYYFAPIAYEIENIAQIGREVFGPVLHVIRYRGKDRDAIIDDINSTGYGLTFGLHSRLESRFDTTVENVQAGNAYINRSIIGAVVGVQPFGGMGLSGTGPKAGGPYYLHRFATEKAVTINTTATGGNLALISLQDE